MRVFQSTPPARGATAWISVASGRPRTFQSTPPARGATKSGRSWFAAYLFQSTPPARGGDDDVVFYVMPEDTISIHAPREGGDNQSFPLVGVGVGFQSTPPARGATAGHCFGGWLKVIFQSTPPARGATRLAGHILLMSAISIHAPREGGDPRICPSGDAPTVFQSTPPARGATTISCTQ